MISNLKFKVKQRIPFSIKRYLLRQWRYFNPSIVTLSNLYPGGCHFEVRTETEEYRIKTLDNESEFIRLFLSEVQPGIIFFDIGSCLGLYAIHASLYKATVFAFEPDPSLRKRLRRNIQLNHQQNSISLIPWAVSSNTGKVNFYTNGVEGKSPSLSAESDRNCIVVDTDSIDHAIDRKILPRPSLIKLDIEGAEILALRGMTNLLKLSQNLSIFIEFHPHLLENFGSSVEECETIVKNLGYSEEYRVSRDSQIHCVYRKS